VSAAMPAAMPDARTAVVERVRREGAVAVLRLPDAAQTVRAAEWLVAGGVTALEVTLTTRGAIDAIRELVARHGDAALVGAGSVLEPDQARRAVDAGARFIVSPVCLPEVIEAAAALGVPAMPGAFTPTEALRAHQAGASIVKVFPSEVLGPAFIKGVLAPMPFLKLMPTGGVTPDNVGQWLAAGAIAVGLGSALADPKLVAAGDEAAVVARARTLVANVRAARAQGGQA
jgi:2-dehydro-3-deoxyphosphogluconate aldolase / (4S)-4-hydroxy-2-oxoglutarate aldolase